MKHAPNRRDAKIGERTDDICWQVTNYECFNDRRFVIEVKWATSEYYPIGSSKSVVELSDSARRRAHGVDGRKEPYSMKRQESTRDSASETVTKPIPSPSQRFHHMFGTPDTGHCYWMSRSAEQNPSVLRITLSDRPWLTLRRGERPNLRL